MSSLFGLRAAAALTALAGLFAAGCTQPRTVCGDPSPRGGPPLVQTKDAELCEAVRLRTIDALAKIDGFGPERAEILRDRTWSWEDARTVEGFLRRVHDDAGAAVEAAIRLAVEQVEEHSRRRVRTDCGDAERCLVRGAALGARIAFDDVRQFLLRVRERTRGSSPPPQD